MIYLDTSALASIYFPDPISVRVEQLLTAQPRSAISELGQVEVYSAVSRRLRLKELTRAEADTIIRSFNDDLSNRLFAVLSLSSSHFARAREWIGRFDTPLRTLDALHLAMAVENRLHLVTGDKVLAKSGEKAGVQVTLLQV